MNHNDLVLLNIMFILPKNLLIFNVAFLVNLCVLLESFLINCFIWYSRYDYFMSKDLSENGGKPSCPQGCSSLTQNIPLPAMHETFPSAKDLLRHQSVHTKVKEHQCGDCQKTYTDISCLRRHRLKVTYKILKVSKLRAAETGERVFRRHLNESVMHFRELFCGRPIKRNSVFE